MNPLPKLLDHLHVVSFYPKDQYGKDRTRILFFLIALNNTTESIVKYVKETVLPKFPLRLNSHDQAVRKVTPLHLAVMTERLDVVEELLVLGADPNAADAGGWTPYHLSALTANYVVMKKVFDRFPIKHGLKTKAGDTYEDLLVHTGRTPQKWGMAKTFILEEGKRILITEDNLSKMGFESYTDTVVFSPETYPFLWKKRYEGIDPLTKEYEKAYENLSVAAPKLVIAPDDEISNSSGKKCFGLQAGEDISFGSAICMYAGLITPERPSNFFMDLINDDPSKDYEFIFQQGMAIDPFKNGNAARFINDGVPNVGLRFVPGKGLIVIALKNIQEGEFLHFNYETFPKLKWLGSFLKDKEALLDFFKQMPLRNLFNNFSSQKSEKDSKLERLKHLRNGVLTCFPLWTPTAFVYLSLTKTVSAKEWLALFDEPESFENIKIHLKNNATLICWTLSLLDELMKFETWLEEFEKSNPDDSAQIRSYFFEMLDTRDIPRVLKAFNLFKTSYHAFIGRFDEYREKIKGIINNYSWLDSDPIFLPRFRKYADGQVGLVIPPQFQALYRKYHLIQ